jgi:hypothetical protein
VSRMPSDLLPSGNEVETTGLIRTAAGIKKSTMLDETRRLFLLLIALFQRGRIRCHVMLPDVSSDLLQT